MSGFLCAPERAPCPLIVAQRPPLSYRCPPPSSPSSFPSSARVCLHPRPPVRLGRLCHHHGRRSLPPRQSASSALPPSPASVHDAPPSLLHRCMAPLLLFTSVHGSSLSNPITCFLYSSTLDVPSFLPLLPLPSSAATAAEPCLLLAQSTFFPPGIFNPGRC